MNAYVILHTERDQDGFIPCIVVEGERGYYRTDWRWNVTFELAEHMAWERNLKMGTSRDQALRIVLQSMRRS